MSEYPTYLVHYGVPGQKWGERQYQNLDGTWTEEGKRRRRVGDNSFESSGSKTTKTTKKTKSAPKETDEEFFKRIRENVPVVNGNNNTIPGKKGWIYGYNRQVNCAFCTMAYELRCRGLDIRAQEAYRGVWTGLNKENGAYGKVIPNFEKVSKKARTFSNEFINYYCGTTKETYEDLKKQLIKDGDGRGFISCQYIQGMGGHIFNYEVHNGELYFIDNQPSETCKAGDYFYENQMKWMWSINTLKTDNLKIDLDKAKKFYAEDNIGDVRLNELKFNRKKVVGTSSIIGGVAGVAAAAAIVVATSSTAGLLALGIPAVTALCANSITKSEVARRDRKAAKELQKKWESEGRLKEKWYDYDEKDDNKDLKGNDRFKELSIEKQMALKALLDTDATQAEIAQALGVSLSTIQKYK